MNVLKYFIAQYRLLIYTSLAAIFSLLIANLTGDIEITNILRLFSLFILLAYIMRAVDDIHDYKKDRRQHKKHYLSKNELILISLLLVLIFIILNFVYFSLSGAFSILLVAIICIWELFPLCKVIFLPLTSTIYLYFSGGQDIFQQYQTWIILIILLFISCAFYAYKRGGK